MYPESNAKALLQQVEVEAAISDLVEIALELWLPLAENAVLQAAAPPPNPEAVGEPEAQWNYLVDALILYGVSMIVADTVGASYSALTGSAMAAGEAVAAAVPDVDMPGMPTRSRLREMASRTITRRTRIDVDAAEEAISRNSALRGFVSDYAASARDRIADVVGRAYRRLRGITDETPDADQAREEVRTVFDPLDEQWRNVADEIGRTQATAGLNAAVEYGAEQAGNDLGQTIEREWVAILDSHTRAAHAAADGQVRRLGTTFDVGGEQLRWPGDIRGSYENTVNCRCRTFAYFADITASGAPDDIDDDDDFEMPEEYNWVDDCGGLPNYIKRISRHLRRKGMTESHAIATAVNAVKKMCATGDTNFPGRQSVSDMSRARACRAVAQWERLRACAARRRAQNSADTAELAAEDCAECSAGHDNIGDDDVSYRSFTGVLAVIGEPTDDGRMFADDIALSFRDFPLPLMWCKQSSGGHIDAYTVGVIEYAEVDGSKVVGAGYFLNTPEADEAAGQVEHGVTGPSVDLGDVTWELRDESGNAITSEEEYAELGPDAKLFQTVLSAKVLAATLVSTPAFGSTSLTLGDPVEVGEDALVAAAAVTVPGYKGLPTYDPAMFTDPGFSEPTYPHMTPEGRIQGHLAAWNVCHVGIQDACVLAPRSKVDYAMFHTAPPVRLSDGTTATVGRLTVGGGHADGKLGIGPTIAHYDDAGTCFALVHVGEDEHGIWFSGVPAPGVTSEQLAAGLAAPLSGDWRRHGGNLELVAALSVNTPGFPLLASGATNDLDEPISLIASLGPCPDESDAKVMTEDQLRAFARVMVEEMRAESRREAEARALIAAGNRAEARALIAKVGA